MRTFSSAENCRRVARRISRTLFSASSECVSILDLISAPLAVTMSPKPSLPQSRPFVQLVLTGNSPRLRANRGDCSEALPDRSIDRSRHLRGTYNAKYQRIGECERHI